MGSKVARITCGFLIATSIYFNAPNRAFAGAAIGATEPTQLLNNIQLVVSYIEQLTTAAENVQQTFMEAENRVRDVAMPFFDAKNRLDNVRDVVKDGLSLAYSVQNSIRYFLIDIRVLMILWLDTKTLILHKTYGNGLRLLRTLFLMRCKPQAFRWSR